MRYNYYPYEEEYDDEYVDHSQYPQVFEVSNLEPQLLGVLYGPKGEVILELYEEKMPFGFNLS